MLTFSCVITTHSARLVQSLAAVLFKKMADVIGLPLEGLAFSGRGA